MARKIVITSGKGGVGKTTIAIHLSAQLAKMGQRVIVCDADFGLNNVDVGAGIEHLVVYDVVDVIEGRCRAKQALVRHTNIGNLYFLGSSHSAPERYDSPQAVKVVLDTLAPQFDFIIIDCPTGMDEGFHRAVATADEAIVVATPQIASLRDADKIITLLKSYQFKELSVVLNMVRGDLLISGDCLSPKEIVGLLKMPLLAILPETYELYQMDLQTSHPAFKVFAENLVNHTQNLYDVTKKYAGFLGNIRRVIKRKL